VERHGELGGEADEVAEGGEAADEGEGEREGDLTVGLGGGGEERT
jgi:hypothetical protein